MFACLADCVVRNVCLNSSQVFNEFIVNIFLIMSGKYMNDMTIFVLFIKLAVPTT